MSVRRPKPQQREIDSDEEQPKPRRTVDTAAPKKKLTTKPPVEDDSPDAFDDDDEDDEEEERKRQARIKAKKKAAREAEAAAAAAAATTAPSPSRATASHADLMREFAGRTSADQPRFKRTVDTSSSDTAASSSSQPQQRQPRRSVADDEEPSSGGSGGGPRRTTDKPKKNRTRGDEDSEPVVLTRKPSTRRQEAEAEEEPKPPKRRTKSTSSDDGDSIAAVSPRTSRQSNGGNNTSSSSTAASSSARRTAAANPRQIVEEENEDDNEAQEEREAAAAEEADQVDSLPTRAATTSAFDASSGSGGDVDRARITSIAAAQKSLDVTRLNRVLKRIPPVFFQKENFNPFNHWNDPKEQLEEWKEYIDSAVEIVVEAYHKGFNTATSSFSHVLDKFNETQKLVKKLQESLSESKRLLQSRNHNLKEYYYQNKLLTTQKMILEKIAYVVEIPQWIDEYMKKKMYLHATILLQHTLSLLVSDDLVLIDGLLELREEILIRKHFIQGFFVEELQKIVYERKERGGEKGATANGEMNGSSSAETIRPPSSAADTQLAFHSDGTRYRRVNPLLAMNEANQSNGKSGGQTNGGANAGANGAAAQSRPSPLDSKYSPFYWSTSSSSSSSATFYDDDTSSTRTSNGSSSEVVSPALRALLLEEESDSYLKNPEANTTRLMRLIISALDHMHYLPSCKTQIQKCIRSELLEIIQRETNIVKEKSKFLLPRRSVARATESGYLTQGSELLIELIERIFSILLQVLKHHYELISMIRQKLNTGEIDSSQEGRKSMNEKSAPSSTSSPSTSSSSAASTDMKFSIQSVWEIIQIVIQTTLTDYLHGLDSNPPLRTNKTAADASMKSVKKGGLLSSATKSSSSKSNTVVHDLLSDLTFSFDASNAPSIAKLARGEKAPLTWEYRAKLPLTSTSKNGAQNGANDPSLDEQSTWIVSTPYNITAVYRPVVAFTDQARNMIQQGNGGSKSDAGSSSITDDPVGEGGNQLRNFLRIFIDVSFLPRVEADVNIRLDEVLNDPQAFDAREAMRDVRYSYHSHAAAAVGLTSAASTSTAMSQLRTYPCAELEHNLLFKCVLDISDVLRKNYLDMYLLPHSQSEYLRIIEHVATRLFEKCVEKFQMDLVKQSHITAGSNLQGFTPTPTQLLWSSDEKILECIEDDPLLRMLRRTNISLMSHSSSMQQQRQQQQSYLDLEDEDELVQYFSHHNPLYATHFHRNSSRFDRSQLQFDSRVWSQLSLMAESLEWMADRIYHMNVFSPEMSQLWNEQMQAKGGPGAGQRQRMYMSTRRPSGKYSNRAGAPRLDSFRYIHTAERSRHGTAFEIYLAGKSLIDQKRWLLAENFLELADRCLFTLRLELHSHIIYYIKEMQSGAYWCATDSTEPESFVLELNRDLTTIDEAIGKYLATPKKNYVFGGCSELITNLLIRTLSQLQDKRVNTKGVSKICRNLFAIQQNLNNIDGTSTSAHVAPVAISASPSSSPQQRAQETHFDRARQYYELLNYTTEDLHLFQLENPDMFSSEDYSALMTIQTQTRGPEGRFM